VYSGWLIQTGKTVTAGEGLVGGCWCETVVSTDISALLTNNQVNYVYAIADSTSPQDGTIDILVSLSSTAPSGGVRLGSITLNSSGVVTAVDNNDDNYRRDYLPQLRMNNLEGVYSTTILGGLYEDVEVDHSDERTFNIGLVPTFSAVTAGCRIELMLEDYSNSKFTVRIYNDAGTAYNNAVSFTWNRWGM
jgi:hypothetical protein